MKQFPPCFSLLGQALLALLVIGCGAGSRGVGKWQTPLEKSQVAEQHLRRDLKVERREAMSNSPTDSGDIWFLAEIVQYNSYGQPTLEEEMDLQGKVIKTVRYEYQDSLLMRHTVQEASGYSSAISYAYDAQGRKTDEWLMQRGDTTFHRHFQCDAIGNETVVDLLRYRDRARLQLKTERDDLGQPKLVQELEGGKTNWSETYTLTDSLWIIRREDGQQKLQALYEMRMDKKGNVVSMLNKDDQGRSRMHIRYQNDDNGRVLEEKHFGPNGMEMQTVNFTYDDKGLLVKRALSTTTQAFHLTSKYSYRFR